MKKFKSASDIRVGVIGYGGQFNMGKVHLQDMQKAGMTPLAVAELDAARLEVARVDFPEIETYDSPDKMLKSMELDLVVIITPHNTHYDLAMKCLRAGKHVVCEKPLCITTAEADKLVTEAKRRKLLMTAFHNRHWDGNIMRAVEQIRSGVIGEVVRIDGRMGRRSAPGSWWRSSKSMSGGILYDWGVHMLEYAFQVMEPSEMTEVTGFAKRGYWASQPGAAFPKDSNEDEATVIVRFKDGRWIRLTITHLDPAPPEGFFDVIGTLGNYCFQHDQWELITTEDGQTVRRSGRNPHSQWENFYANIAGFMVGKEKLVITPEWSRRPIHVLDLADRSAKLGRTLKTKHK
jgi:predicted dehydrogenase